MLDINYLKDNKDKVQNALADRGLKVDLDKIFELDTKRRELLVKVDDLRRERNLASEKRDVEMGLKIKQQLGELEESLRKIETEFEELILEIPNVPLDHIQRGGEDQNKVLRTEGKVPEFTFKVLDHVELGEKLDIIDLERAGKVSGSRFVYLKNEGVILQFALVQLALETLLKEGFTPVIPPVMVKSELTKGLGYWQVGGNDNYYQVTDFQESESGVEASNQLYLIGTGEHAVVPMHQGETFEGSSLPKKYVAISSCFRREAGTYGKDTKGIIRLHQFDKIEMVEFVRSVDDETERKKLLAQAENFLKMLGLSYQVVQASSGDLSFPAAETVDLETWIPSQGKYRETHSISTTTDFQARRLKIKYRPTKNSVEDVSGSQGTEYVHILNGTALAIGRTLVAILENYQQSDGSVKIPEVLQKYTNFSQIKPKG